jgi:hypothetical protein
VTHFVGISKTSRKVSFLLALSLGPARSPLCCSRSGPPHASPAQVIHFKTVAPLDLARDARLRTQHAQLVAQVTALHGLVRSQAQAQAQARPSDSGLGAADAGALRDAVTAWSAAELLSTALQEHVDAAAADCTAAEARHTALRQALPEFICEAQRLRGEVSDLQVTTTAALRLPARHSHLSS